MIFPDFNQWEVITNPNNDGTEVRRSLVVEGTASIPSGTHLWVLVRREDFEGLWWPQGEGIIDPISKKWKVPVQFGIPDDIGWHFDLVAIVVDNSQHAILRNYRIIAMKTGDWRPIEIPKVLASPTMRSVIKVGH